MPNRKLDRVVQANKNAIDALKWVNRATHKKNPDQMCIFVRGLTVAAMNGFQIHVIIPQIDQPFQRASGWCAAYPVTW